MSAVHSMSIFEAMQKVRDGGFAIPLFQREYVWTLPQIEKLWDSILTGYPISTFLLWKCPRDERNGEWYLKFLSEASFSKTYNAAPEKATVPAGNVEFAVLDGQQRLTSLYLSLYGTCRKRNELGLYLELYPKEDEALRDEDGFEDNCRYRLKFSESSPGENWFRVKAVVEDSEFQNPETRTAAIESAVACQEEHRESAMQMLNLLCNGIFDEKNIQYLAVDGNEDQAMEMFIRFNNGGKPLSKADIQLATISQWWPGGHSEIKKIVKLHFGAGAPPKMHFEDYKDFGLAFITRLSIMLFGNLEDKLDRRVVLKMMDNWRSIVRALERTIRFLNSKSIQVTDYAKSWNVLLPVIYLVYKTFGRVGGGWEETSKHIRTYLARAELLKYFTSGGTTGKLAALKRKMDDCQNGQPAGLPALNAALLDEIPGLQVTPGKLDDILAVDYKRQKPLVNLALKWVNGERGKDFTRESVDHLHPQRRFLSLPPEGISLEKWGEWKKLSDQLPNLQFASLQWNSIKSDRPLSEFWTRIGERDKTFYWMNDLLFDGEREPELLHLCHFDAFFERRREEMRRRLADVLALGD